MALKIVLLTQKIIGKKKPKVNIMKNSACGLWFTANVQDDTARKHSVISFSVSIHGSHR